MCLGNIAWSAYAIAINDIWVGLPAIVNLPIGIIMLKVAHDQRGVVIHHTSEPTRAA